MAKKAVLGILAVLVAGLFALLAVAADPPLSPDDVTLLLLAGSPAQKMVALVEQRGISFKMNPDLAKKFHDAGASDDLIEALTKAGLKAKDAASGPAASAPAPPPPQQAPSTNAPAANSNAAEVDRKVAETLSSLESNSAGDDHPYAARFSLVALSGKKIDLADYKGKVVLLNFWASWCPHCRRLIPALVGFQDQYYDKGLRIVGIAVGDQKQAVQSFYQHGNINYPVAMGDAYTRKLYGGISGLPTTLLIGRDGRIYSRFEGDPQDFSPLEERIKWLLALAPGGTEGNQQTAAKPASPTTSAMASQATIGGASSPVPTAASGASSASPAASAPAPVASQQTPSANAPAATSNAAEVNRKVAETLRTLEDKPVLQPTHATDAATSATSAKPGPDKSLTDPDPIQIQRIIQEFAAKEKLFKEARNNYTYHQINKVQELGPDNEVVGVFEQEWDILFDDSGKRIERVTYAPTDTLKRIMVTQEDLSSMRSIQPFVLTTDELPEYEIKYLGHVKVDQITAYVFSVRPKEIEKGHQYFQGVVWVDDQDLQIVKSEGKPVPELKTKKGENLFPRFTTWREQIDGKYWFPTYTMADDTLYFSSGPVHIKQILRYTDYKQFKSKVRIVSATPTDRPNAPAIPAPPNK